MKVKVKVKVKVKTKVEVEAEATARARAEEEKKAEAEMKRADASQATADVVAKEAVRWFANGLRRRLGQRPALWPPPRCGGESGEQSDDPTDIAPQSSQRLRRYRPDPGFTCSVLSAGSVVGPMSAPGTRQLLDIQRG